MGVTGVKGAAGVSVGDGILGVEVDGSIISSVRVGVIVGRVAVMVTVTVVVAVCVPTGALEDACQLKFTRNNTATNNTMISLEPLS